MSRKAVKWAALGGLACAAAAWATAALALPANGHWYIYYSDASHSQIVGEEYLSCGGLYDLDGYKTPHKLVVDEWPCCSNGADCPWPPQ